MEVFPDTLAGSAELSAFCKQDVSQQEFTDVLRSILEVTAVTGLYWHEWDQLKLLLSFRLKQVLKDYYGSNDGNVVVGPPRPLITGETFQELEDRLDSGFEHIHTYSSRPRFRADEGLNSFMDGAPFTIQRLCEVLLNPRDRYPNLDKVALAFEKETSVLRQPVSGMHDEVPPSAEPYPSPQLRAAVSAKEEDRPQKVQRTENMETVPIITTTTVPELPNTISKYAEEPVQVPAPDEEMVDVESVEAKATKVESGLWQPSETGPGVEARPDLASMESEKTSAKPGEWQPVEQVLDAAGPGSEGELRSITMVDSSPDQARL